MSFKADHHFDYFVIGGGSAGVRSARIAAQKGVKVGIAEGRYWGGTCVNVGCIPKKIMALAADIDKTMSYASSYGFDISRSFSWDKLISASHAEISRLNGIYKSILEQNNVTLFEDYAQFLDSHHVQIGNQVIHADYFLIATGGKPNPISYPYTSPVLTSDDFFHLKEQPKKAVLLGGGYISVELAGILKNLGSDVTIVHRGPHLLRGFDCDIQDHLLHLYQSQGIPVYLNQSVVSYQDPYLRLSNDLRLECDAVISALGRTPNFDKLYLDRAGLYPCDKGFLQVDENFRTTHAHIFAAGDVLQQEHLTPVAIAQGHYIANFLFDPPSTQKKDFDFIATAIFSSPEIATLGLTEQELHRRQKPYKVYKTNFRPLKETIANTSYKSCLYKIVVCAETDRILGLHLCGPYVSEILQGFAAAIRQGLTKSELDQTLAIHPTMAEEIVLMPNLSEKTNPERLAS